MVPVYNAELYIENCIKSLFRQTHSDIEIIAVDDGSTDGSYAKLLGMRGLEPHEVSTWALSILMIM